DVPTRQSYISSIVEPHERTFAIGILNVTRTLGWGLSPALAGQAMKGLSLSAPFFIGSSIKIFYDLTLYKNFRNISEGA
ncbi:MAG: MFS transporter, partial [Deltaproteobacteria bacterium]|nr:MFS transporter [Deltaproteobacteria bacterium]